MQRKKDSLLLWLIHTLSLFTQSPATSLQLDLKSLNLLELHIKVRVVILEVDQLCVDFFHRWQRPILVVDVGFKPCFFGLALFHLAPCRRRLCHSVFLPFCFDLDEVESLHGAWHKVYFDLLELDLICRRWC